MAQLCPICGYRACMQPTDCKRPKLRILVSNETLARQIAADPDSEECEAGTLHPEAPSK